jgi:hypothetical protein
MILLPLAALGADTATTFAQTTLRYQFKAGNRIPYVLEQKIKMTINAQGNEVQMNIAQNVEITWNIASVDSDGKAKMTQKIGRIRFSMDGLPTGKIEFDSKDGKEPEGPVGKILAPLLKSMAGAEISLTMDPQGRSSDVKVPKELVDAVKNSPAAAQLGEMFSEEGFKRLAGQGGLVLSAEPVNKGSSWDQKIEMKLPVGKMTVDNKLTYEGPVERDGKTVQKVALHPVLTLEGGPNAPATIKLKDQNSKGNAFFDNAAGRLLETDLTQNMDMEVNAGGQTVTQKMEQTVTLKLAEQKKE